MVHLVTQFTGEFEISHKTVQLHTVCANTQLVKYKSGPIAHVCELHQMLVEITGMFPYTMTLGGSPSEQGLCVCVCV